MAEPARIQAQGARAGKDLHQLFEWPTVFFQIPVGIYSTSASNQQHCQGPSSSQTAAYEVCEACWNWSKRKGGRVTCWRQGHQCQWRRGTKIKCRLPEHVSQMIISHPNLNCYSLYLVLFQRNYRVGGWLGRTEPASPYLKRNSTDLASPSIKSKRRKGYRQWKNHIENRSAIEPMI